MRTARGSRTARTAGQLGEAAVVERVEVLFARFDRLTPDELARIGLLRADPAEREALLARVAAAARSSGRSTLLAQARTEAREAVLRRYSEGGLHPTWVGLNWGVSQGTTGDRVAIVDALSDAAAAAVVEDLVPADVTEALALDAAHVLGLPVGDASEGSLDRSLRPSPTGRGTTRLVAMLVLGCFLGAWGLALGTMGAGPPGGLVGLAVALLVTWTITRPRGTAARDADEEPAANDAG